MITLEKRKERFEDNVAFEPNTGCWLWLGCQNKGGYGRIMLNGKVRGAHRISYLLYKAEDANEIDQFDICHHCDNPSCVNPDHLFKGTALDNILDMIRKGRHRPVVGEQKPNAVLTSQHAAEIKHEFRDLKIRLAEKFKVNPATIELVWKNRIWKHI